MEVCSEEELFLTIFLQDWILHNVLISRTDDNATKYFQCLIFFQLLQKVRGEMFHCSF